jgi:hypothetical protein
VRVPPERLVISAEAGVVIVMISFYLIERIYCATGLYMPEKIV